jgi:hypothetical protein
MQGSIFIHSRDKDMDIFKRSLFYLSRDIKCAIVSHWPLSGIHLEEKLSGKNCAAGKRKNTSEILDHKSLTSLGTTCLVFL